MTLPAVEYDDLELWLSGYLRARLTSWAAIVDRRFPARTWLPGYAVVVRDDSGPDRSVNTAERRVGLTVIGAESGYSATAQLAQRVATLLRISPIPGDDSPVAACLGVRGPYSLDATGRTEFYLSADLIVVGRAVTI